MNIRSRLTNLAKRTASGVKTVGKKVGGYFKKGYNDWKNMKPRSGYPSAEESMKAQERSKTYEELMRREVERKKRR